MQPVWNHQSLIIDFRLWMETWEGMGSWEMGEGRGEVHRKEDGVVG